MECTVETEKEDETAVDRALPVSFTEKRHVEAIQGLDFSGLPWRLKERMKTVSVALVLCLNVGVDPPDIVKTQPCARLECWIDPLNMSPPKALEAIGTNLQKQYERWQPRARYKQALDPTSEDVKKLCTSLRRNAKDERVLFHYNGHGVPKPTTNGEIWVFNRTYTQYIPLSIYDLQSWMGSPSIYVYDCSNAGLIIESFNMFARQHEHEFEAAVLQSRIPPNQEPPAYNKCIHLAACSSTQVLPMNPDLPADLFTSCLTTPIKVAVRWFITRHSARLVPELNMELMERIPGQLADRKTMLGELNWILTAITDTIAWNILPRELFQKLFRQDLLVASLFRNFLLAERVLRSYGCTPVSSPALPHTHQHPMWNAWDYALDLSLKQLPNIINHSKPYRQLTFFEDQLTAFQVWLRLGSPERDPPVQLPIVLQVLLSQVHRLRALELLAKFLDLGSWAVNLGLSVGIFPYVLKLLQSSAMELRPLLVFIWAKILSVDNTCQNDLVREKAHTYFIAILKDPNIAVEYRTQAAFVLSCIVNGCQEGQELAKKDSLVSNCLFLLNDPNSRLKKWVIICLGRLWDRHESTRMVGGRDNAHGKLESVLMDSCPEVRAAAVYACGTYINAVTNRYDHINTIDHSLALKLYNTLGNDMNYMVRLELVAALQWVVFPFEQSFIYAANQENNSNSEGSATPTLRRTGSRPFMSPNTSFSDSVDTADRIKRVASSSSISALGQGSLSHHGSLGTLSSGGHGKSFFTKIWSGLCRLEKDSHPEVAQAASKITLYIRNKLKESLALTKEQMDRMSSSMSLPPSPNRSSNYLSGDSPPTLSLNSDLHRYAAKTSLAHRNRRLYQNEEKSYVAREPLVTTQFVAWSCKYFAEPLMKSEEIDVESVTYYEREWRFERNAMVRRDAMEEQKRCTKVDTQLFNMRTAAPPKLLKFHPNDQQIVVASNDNFGIWDWGRGAKICQRTIKSAKYPSNTHITAFEWINSQDIALLMTGSDDGSIHLWNPQKCINKEPSLLSSWQAYSDMMPIKMTNLSGLLINWEQQTQTVITAGDSKHIRFWDVEREQFAFEIATETQSAVTCLDSTFINSSSEGIEDGIELNLFDGEPLSNTNNQKERLVAAAFKNGHVKLFDRRCPAHEVGVRSWIEQKSWILGMKLRDNNIITGCIDGEVRLYDIRKNDPITVTQVAQPNEMCAFAIHPTADVYACGLVSHCVSVHNLSGRSLNMIRHYEGFMSHKIGPVSCLAFHPRKIALAAGNVDCSVTLYTDGSRR